MTCAYTFYADSKRSLFGGESCYKTCPFVFYISQSIHNLQSSSSQIRAAVSRRSDSCDVWRIPPARQRTVVIIPTTLNITQHEDTDSPCSVLDLRLLSAAIGTSVTEPDWLPYQPHTALHQGYNQRQNSRDAAAKWRNINYTQTHCLSRTVVSRPRDRSLLATITGSSTNFNLSDF